MPQSSTTQDTPGTSSVTPDDNFGVLAPPTRYTGGHHVHHSPGDPAVRDVVSQIPPAIETSGSGIGNAFESFTPVSSHLNRHDSGLLMDTEQMLGEETLESVDPDWWDLTFVEAGFEHLAGLEPISNFMGLDNST